MCTELIVGGKYIDSLGELREFLGGEPVIPNSYGEKPLGDDICLCCVDEEATAAKFGLSIRTATEEEGWPFIGFVLEKRP